jgi:hypothetical protein
MKRIMMMLLAGGGLLSAHGAVDPALFRWTADVAVPLVSREEPAGFEVPVAVFEQAAVALADVRLLDQRGRAVPHLMERLLGPVTGMVEHAVGASAVTAIPDELNNEIQIEYALHTNALPPTRLVIDTPLRDFERMVSVEGCGADGVWRTLVGRAAIFDLSRFINMAQYAVALPPGDCRRFRLTIRGVTDQAESATAEITRQVGGRAATERLMVEWRPLRVDRVRFFAEMNVTNYTAAITNTYPVRGAAVRHIKEGRVTVVRFAVPRVPLTCVRLKVDDQNFSRMYALHAIRSGKDQWGRPQENRLLLSRGMISRFNLRAVQREALDIAIAESRFSDYELVVENGDNPLLNISGVEVSGPAYQIDFIARPDESYRLFFGGVKDMPPPDYDVAALRALREQERSVVRAVLSSVRPNTACRPEKAVSGNVLRRLLGAALVLIVIVLGWALLRAWRRMEPPAGDDPPA